MDKNTKKFVEDVLKSSGKIAVKYYRKASRAESKKDGSLVTRADRDIEHHIRLQIKKRYPMHAILGEEFGYEKSRQRKSDKKQYTWVIDPIDGTSSFVAGRPLFGIMLALIENGKPILGAVYQPITKELWIGYRKRTTLNGKQVKVNKTKKGGFVVATTSPNLLDKAGLKKWDKLRKTADTAIYGGDCYNYCLLASGYIDAVFEQNLQPHDYLPLLPILIGAGASIELDVDTDGVATILASAKPL